MFDRIETLGKSIIQHGDYNDRIYLMSLNREDIPDILPQLDALATENGYSKIFAKIPFYALEEFLSFSYVNEAFIVNFFKGKEDAFFMGKFLTKERQQEQHMTEVRDIIQTAKSKAGILPDVEHPPFQLRQGTPKDADAIAECYKEVFDTYPFPIHDPDYLREIMEQDVDYFTLWDGDSLAAVSSAEKDPENKNVEMTDFATREKYRGQGLALYLLHAMESQMIKQHYRTAFTIARAYSYGMNITFGKMGYRFSGTLVNNTQISGSIQSMNIWYKHLNPSKTDG